MGQKRPSIRTLPSGEKVMHYPDGTQRLIPEDKVRSFLDTIREDVDRRSDEIDHRLMEAVRAKKESLDSGDSVPDDKRPV